MLPTYVYLPTYSGGHGKHTETDELATAAHPVAVVYLNDIQLSEGSKTQALRLFNRLAKYSVTRLCKPIFLQPHFFQRTCI